MMIVRKRRTAPVAEQLEASGASAAPVAEQLEASGASAAPVAEQLEASGASAAPVADIEKLSKALVRERLYSLYVDAIWYHEYHDRCGKPSAENVTRDAALAMEKAGCSWSQLFANHPDDEPEKLRSAVRRFRDKQKP
jgi:hypothetical protein